MKFDGVDIDAIHHKMTVKQQKEHYDKFARFGCILCYYLGYGEGCPAELHHIRTGNIPRKQAPVILSVQSIIEEIPEYMDLDAKVSLNFTELMKITC